MKIFMAFPFTQLCDARTGILQERYIEFLNNLRNDLLCLGHSVFLAHYREGWGKEVMEPKECTPADYEEMKNTDLVISFPGSPISGGVHIELGWASAMSKKILLLLNENQLYSPLVLGLHTICDTEVIEYVDVFDSNFVHDAIILKVSNPLSYNNNLAQL